MIKELRAEWRKLIWPSREDLKTKVSQVIVSSVILGSIITVADYAFQNIINLITGLF